jgi:hypothetical protein
VIVLGDLVVDVVLAPATELVTGTDVPGWVMLRQGGSATTTARLGRSGARVTLIAAVGRDAAGRSPLRAVRADGVTPHVARVAGCATGRIGVLVAPGGERSFVQDRGAALRLSPEHLREAWSTSAASSNPVSRSKLESLSGEHPTGCPSMFPSRRYGAIPLRRAWRASYDPDEKGAGRPERASGSFSACCGEGQLVGAVTELA